MYFNYLLLVPSFLSLVTALPTSSILAEKDIRSSIANRDSVSSSSSTNGTNIETAIKLLCTVTNHKYRSLV